MPFRCAVTQNKKKHIPINSQEIPAHQETLKHARPLIKRQRDLTRHRPLHLHARLLLLIGERDVEVLSRIPYRFLFLLRRFFFQRGFLGGETLCLLFHFSLLLGFFLPVALFLLGGYCCGFG